MERWVSFAVSHDEGLVEMKPTYLSEECEVKTNIKFMLASVVVSLYPLGVFAEQLVPAEFEGVWSMASAYEIKADGTRTTNYGEHPNGLLMIDKSGRYSLQIFRPNRPKFASGDKTRGTPEEYREAALGSSTHMGWISIDAAQGQLTFKIDAASYPNWEGAQQVREYVFKDGVLTYSVPASASGNGTVAYSVWQHLSR